MTFVFFVFVTTLMMSALSWERKTTNAICSFRMFLFDLLPESLRTRLYQAIPQLVPSFFPTRRLIQSLFILAPSTMCIILTPSAPGFPVGGCTGKSRSAPGNPGQLRGIPVSSGKSRSAAAGTRFLGQSLMCASCGIPDNEFLILPFRHFIPCILRWQSGD